MAEFVEVMKQAKRMCGMYSSCADGCPLGMYGDCFASAIPSDIDDVEGTVMQWAKEHPKPQYGTWGEWFVERGELIEGYENATSNDWSAARFREIMSHPIPADIAEKLGIKPKGGDGDA